MFDKAKLAQLQDLLKQEEEQNKKRHKDMLVVDTQPIRTALETFGVLAPSSIDGKPEVQKVWDRGVAASLYSVPTSSPPVTTIVPLSSLPKQSQMKEHGQYIQILKMENGDALVEVPISAIMPDTTTTLEKENGGGGRQGQLPSQRPLNGNLSSKLVEYTRGQVGKRQPFKPGGMDQDETESQNGDMNMVQGEGKEEAYLPYCSPEEIKNAFEVFEKGSIVAWNDGTLLTAPPGVSFKVGLSLEDVYNIEELQKMGYKPQFGSGAEINVKDRQGGAEVDINDDFNEGNGRAAGSASNVIASKMWDKSYFDDDSLFGDSSSGSSSDDESSIDDEGDDETKNQDEEGSSHASNDDLHADTDEEDVEDIDAFITELILTTTASKLDQTLQAKQKKSSSLTLQNINHHNPLKVADERQPSKERKCWAVTTLLNLSDFYSVVPNPAITYPFELDDFQKQAVARLERGECIFVAAHTSAGKTVCAEYAIALARKHCTRAIYTSPIKALSNQKYRDFQDKFGDDVGLITGDLQINADSSCLIMTTEILRSMLYRGADLIRDIEWVIFDEVHYINDTERGVVWEEVIIMLPDYVNMIFLSATTPNTNEFSDWIGRTKKKPVHVIRTDYRPVPLSHHLFAGRKLHKVMEGKSGFLDKGYKEATLSLLPASEREKKEKGGKKKGSLGGSKQNVQTTRHSSGSSHSAWQQSGSRQDWMALIKFLEREELMPTVIFSFSKKKCEEIANMLRSLDLNTASERNAAHAFAIQTMKRLSPKDACLPQVITTCEMVKRGIGVHHGGLLPILKEMVEILFSRNLIKVLFATETFAMGVNMPARAVVFNSIRKHDGTRFRVLEPGEYTQMAGRAGRRGLDKIGTVIMCCFGEEPPPQYILRNMLTGSSTLLSSQFRLTYNMILNLLRVEDMTVEGMIKRSFSEFATQRALTTNEYPKLLKRGTKALAKLEEEFIRDSHTRIGAEDISDYYSASSELISLNKEGLNRLLGSAGNTAGGALIAGRVLVVTSARKKGFARSPAIVVKSPQMASTGNTISKSAVCIVLLPPSYTHTPDESNPVAKEFHLGYVGSCKNRNYTYAHIDLDEVLFVSSAKHKIDADKLYKEETSFGGLGGSKPRASNSFFNNKPMARKVDDFGFGSMKARSKGDSVGAEGKATEEQSIEKVLSYLLEAEYMESNAALEILSLKECTKSAVFQGDEVLRFGTISSEITHRAMEVRSYKSHLHPSLVKHYTIVEKKETLSSTVQALRHVLSNESLQLFPDFLQRKALLKTLNYVDENDTVKVKGRVACECNTCEELIVTEIVFEGILNDLEPAEIVAALSALIFQEKADNELDNELPERLRNTCEAMQKIAINLGQLQSDHGLVIDPKDYCDSSLKFGLVHVVYEWALGVPFSNICQLTLVQEGSIVRCITRLDELCREIRNCARVVGNPTLYRKMEEASVAIKRDIVFASSLYIS